MSHLLDPIRPLTDPVWNWAVGRSKGLSRSTLAWGGLAAAAVILLSVNLLSSILFRSTQADLTADRLYTMSDGTKQILSAIDEPISLTVYFSKKLGEASTDYARYFERVKALLEQYRDNAKGKLELSFLDPEPFSDAEDKAVAAGMRGLRLNAEGEIGYFGMTARSSTDAEAGILFFSPDRDDFIEYDITKIIYALTNPRKRVIGLMSGLPIDGEPKPGPDGKPGQPGPAWAIMPQIREFFDVQKLGRDITEIPADVDVLMVVQPVGLKREAAFAIDQYALKGGKVLLFIDPVAESAQLSTISSGTGWRKELMKVVNAWGIDMNPAKVAADIKNARRVQFGREQGSVTEFVGWLGLGKDSIDQRDVLSNGIEVLNVASAGELTRVDGGTTTITPIIETSTDAMLVEATKFGYGADPLGLIRNYKPEGKRLALAMRVSGEAKSGFPKGRPQPGEEGDEIAAAEKKKKDEEAAKQATAGGSEAKAGDKEVAAKTADAAAGNGKEAAPAEPAKDDGSLKTGRINVIVIADTDLLADRFWMQAQQMMGEQVATPIAHNAAFVVGALENLTGNDAMMALRGRGVADRKFELVEEIRRDAERQFRAKEETLTAKLQSAQTELAKLEKTGESGATAVLSDADRKAIDKFRNVMLETRKELRDVKLALRHDIDRLDGWLKFINIALVPILIGLGGVGWTIWQARRRRAAS